MANFYHTPTSSVSSTASPRFSQWSKEHSSKSSTSSLSPVLPSAQARDSLDLYATQKRLEDVREEEDFPSRQMCSSVDDYQCVDSSSFLPQAHPVIPDYPGYSLSDQDAVSTDSSQRRHLPKRLRSADALCDSATKGFATRFGSLSRRWRNRSAIGPPLSIITTTSPTTSPRPSLDVAVNQHSRSTSISTPSYGIYSPVSMQSLAEESLPESEEVPIYMDKLPQHEDLEEERGQATTPLLPPTMLILDKEESLIQSPLQSPSIAPTHVAQGRRSSDKRLPYLPSPPLSTQPSLASMPKTRANTATQDIPALQQLSDLPDGLAVLAVQLGHSDFTIYPEPYRPNIIDLDSYKQFRENWEYARKQYAQHLARTIEHYGDTSKVYHLTEKKWNKIDREWKDSDAFLNRALMPQLQRLSDDASTPDSPVSLLEKPVSRIIVPQLDKDGKFPEIGDADIIGPLSVGVAKVPELQRGNLTPPTSPRKRKLIKALGGFFKSH